MNSEKLLRQYVDTGLNIGPHQYRGLSPNLQKTYIRKRLIAAQQANVFLSWFEVDAMNDEQKNILKKYPRFFNFFPNEIKNLFNEYLNNLNDEFNERDVLVLVRELPVDDSYDLTIDKILNKYKDKVTVEVMLAILLKYNNADKSYWDDEKYNPKVIEFLEKFVKVKNGLTFNDCMYIGYTSTTNHIYFIKYKNILFNMLLDNYPNGNWIYHLKSLARNSSDKEIDMLLEGVLKNNPNLEQYVICDLVTTIDDDEIFVKYVDMFLKPEKYLNLPRYIVFTSLLFDLRSRHSSELITKIFLKYNKQKITNFVFEDVERYRPYTNGIDTVIKMLKKFNEQFELNEHLNRIKDLIK
jgi:hypothetical protein